MKKCPKRFEYAPSINDCDCIGSECEMWVDFVYRGQTHRGCSIRYQSVVSIMQYWDRVFNRKDPFTKFSDDGR